MFKKLNELEMNALWSACRAVADKIVSAYDNKDVIKCYEATDDINKICLQFRNHYAAATTEEIAKETLAKLIELYLNPQDQKLLKQYCLRISAFIEHGNISTELRQQMLEILPLAEKKLI